jgi:hypothetical protein
MPYPCNAEIISQKESARAAVVNNKNEQQQWRCNIGYSGGQEEHTPCLTLSCQQQPCFSSAREASLPLPNIIPTKHQGKVSVALVAAMLN